MKTIPGTIKKHEKPTWNLENPNRPKTMKNPPGTMKNRPGTIKTDLEPSITLKTHMEP